MDIHTVSTYRVQRTPELINNDIYNVRDYSHSKQAVFMPQIKTHQQTTVEHRRTQPQIILKSEGKQPKLSSKLAKFFGDQPPLINLFLKQLGYEVGNIDKVSTGPC